MSQINLDPRPEGVYCRWETWPPATKPGDNVVHVPGVPGDSRREFTDNILHIEKVWGDCSVSTFECASSEAETILAFLSVAKP
jgi:hypothetical protein